MNSAESGTKTQNIYIVPLWLDLSWLMLLTTYVFFALAVASNIFFFLQGRFIGYFPGISETEIGYFNDIIMSASAPVLGFYVVLNTYLYSVYGRLFMDFAQNTMYMIYIWMLIFWLNTVAIGGCPFSTSVLGQMICIIILLILVDVGWMFFQIVSKPYTDKFVWNFRLILIVIQLISSIFQVLPYSVFNSYRYMTVTAIANVIFYACTLIICATWREDVAKVTFALVVYDDDNDQDSIEEDPNI